MKYYRVTGCLLSLLLFICIVQSGCKNRGMSKTKASEAFRRYVLGPIPESVTNIRYIFRFNINREDLSLLINSKPFVRVWNVKYRNGNIDWYWDLDSPILGIGMHGSSIICYKQSARKPGWFRPGLWDNPEAYAFWKEGNLVNIEVFDKESRGPTEIRVLLYNENDAEAYFVVTYWEN